MTESPSSRAWQRLAAYAGGTVACLTVAYERSGARTVFAGTPVGVFRSVDAGRAWHPAGPPGALPFVTSVAASPDYATDRTLFAGTWTGLFRSRDAGASWHPVLAGGGILAVAVSSAPPDERTVFVGTAADGILRSDDGGEHWIGANAGLLDLSVLALALSPRILEDGTAFAGTASGLYRSRNGGRSWQEVDVDLDDISIQVVALGSGFPDDPFIALGTEDGGLLLSDNGGEDWRAVERFDGRSIAAIELRASAGGSTVIVLAADHSILFSGDEGQSWDERSVLSAPLLALASVGTVGDDASAAVLAGLVGTGIVRLSAAARQWECSNAGLHATPLSLFAVSPSFAHDGTLLAAGADGTVLVSRDHGRTLGRLALDLDEPAVTGLVMSPRFHDDGTVWISTPGTLYRSRDAALTWETLPINAAPGLLDADLTGAALGDAPARVLTAVLDAGRVSLFLAVGGAVAYSDDRGDTWRRLGPIGERETVISLAARPHSGGGLVLFALTVAGDGPGPAHRSSVWRSTTGGSTWERWFDGAADAEPVMLGWDGAPSDANLLVALGGTVLSPRTDAQERRGGRVRPLWRSVSPGPGVYKVDSLATPAGPLAGRIIFAGTNAGVFVSRDGGRTFAPWSEGLMGLGDAAELPAVVALAVSPDYVANGEVFALTAGGVLWSRRER